MLVTKKRVWRFFAKGRGYANPTLAYRAIAKKELGREIAHEVDRLLPGREEDEEARKEVLFSVYAKRFPPCKDRCCCTYTDMGYSTPYARAFCRTAHKAWIDNRIAELRKGDCGE